MVDRLNPDICVIGAGSGGLSVAAGASQMGARVVLIEQHQMGGECLYTGCIPSKALLAAAKTAQTVRNASQFGVATARAQIDFLGVYDHVEAVIADIAPQDSVKRYEGLGVTILNSAARFTGPRELVTGETVVRARRFVIATGSLPVVPAIPGLDQVPYFTNESLFRARIEPEHLVVVGGGPIGVELSQAYRRLGARVTLLEADRILSADDPEPVAIVADRLVAEGVDLREGAMVTAVAPEGAGVAVHFNQAGHDDCVTGSHLLVAIGRRANLERLNLKAAGIEANTGGITVDARLRTANRRIFAIGDATGPYRFTHMANYQAGIVIRNVLFRLPATVDYGAIPWVTYTDPELAHVGLSLEAARATGRAVRVLRWPFDENDRATVEHSADGLVKAIVTEKGRVLGASIVGADAGELIEVWGLAISRGLGVSALASLIVPYPTLSEANKRAAASFYSPTLFGNRTRALVRFLARFG